MADARRQDLPAVNLAAERACDCEEVYGEPPKRVAAIAAASLSLIQLDVGAGLCDKLALEVVPQPLSSRPAPAIVSAMPGFRFLGRRGGAQPF